MKMKLTLDGIKDKKSWEAAGVVLPSYDIEKVKEETKKSPAWVHFGIGNIFRIFIGGIADTLISNGAMDKGGSFSGAHSWRYLFGRSSIWLSGNWYAYV